jgi:hypothetical protein
VRAPDHDDVAIIPRLCIERVAQLAHSELPVRAAASHLGPDLVIA